MFPKLREVHVRNYKSIAQAVVPLADLTVLVGRNGSGKTNFLDAITFVQEALSGTLDSALRLRGGFQTIRWRRGTSPLSQIGIRLIVDLGPETVADYAFELASARRIRFRVVQERCLVRHRDGRINEFVVREGKFEKEIPGIRARLEPDRLALYAASATEEFRGIYDFLAGMRSYNLDPGQIAMLQEADPGLSLNSDGSNAAGVLEKLLVEEQDRFNRVSSLLRKVIVGIREVRPVSMGDWRTVRFDEDGGSFQALSMSEGTLRLLGLLLAIYQPVTPSVLLMEEPEATVHPAAAEMVMSVLLDASLRGQVLVTTHSPDILDHKELPDDAIRVVTKTGGRTIISALAAASRQAIREHLYLPGELLRVDELNGDIEAAENLSHRLDLFGPPAQVRGEAA